MLFPAPLLQAITDGFDAAIYAKDKDLNQPGPWRPENVWPSNWLPA